MKSFEFRLQKVLEWRQSQLEMEESRFQRHAGTLAALDRQRTEIQADALRTEMQLRARESVDGADLAALGSFREFSKRREIRIQQERAECARLLESGRAAMLQAQRRLRLLERLRERQRAKWEAECDRELDQLASDAFLAKWNSKKLQDR